VSHEGPPSPICQELKAALTLLPFRRANKERMQTDCLSLLIVSLGYLSITPCPALTAKQLIYHSDKTNHAYTQQHTITSTSS